MTREELVKMVGSEEQANYAMKIVLGAIKEDFVKSAIRCEIDHIDERLKELESEEYVYICNGEMCVNWNPNKESDKQLEANGLLYTRNRLVSMISVRA